MAPTSSGLGGVNASSRFTKNGTTYQTSDFDTAKNHLQRAFKLGAKPGDVFVIDGKQLRIVDNYNTGKDVQYRPARFPRSPVKPSDPWWSWSNSACPGC